MKLRLPRQWVLPILTACVVLMAIVLPERISAWRDRSLFAAAHVEEFDPEQGVAAPDMSLARRIQILSELYYGEETDAYVRYQDSFTQTENDQIDQAFFTAAETLKNSGIFPLPDRFSLSDMACGFCQRMLVWDSATMGTASFLQVQYYHETIGYNVDLTIDEESGMAVMMTIIYPELENQFSGDDGRELAEIGSQFIKLLGFEPVEVKYGANDAYVIPSPDSELPEYHIGQRYDVLHIEATPDTEKYMMGEYEASVSISLRNGENIYDE